METFVIRIFVAADTQRLPLTGIVEHVSAGRSEAFEGGAELLEFVRRELEPEDTQNRTRPEEGSCHAC
jgi:hypothetical protein